MDPAPGSRLEVGRVGRAHGLHGEVAVTLSSNRLERVAVGSRLYAGERMLEVAGSRPHQRRWLVRFSGVEDRTAAEGLSGCTLWADPLPDLPDDEVWVHEVIGADLVDAAGAHLGVVRSVEANPAHDLMVLESGALVPVVFVTETGPGRVVVDLPAGLLEVNSDPASPRER